MQSALQRRAGVRVRAAYRDQAASSVRLTSPSERVSEPQVSQPASVKLYVRSGWGKGKVHGSLAGQPWKDFPMERVPSSPGKWLRATIQLGAVIEHANGNGGGSPLLEFVLTNGQNDWDKPRSGDNYTITAPGTYAVRGGNVEQVTGKPVMVVSDLDGTMVGDDSATGAFKGWWEDSAVPRGGVLVYNTGRSLESFYQLLKDKGHCLAIPDALISAVGTKIFMYNGSSWEEDTSWSAKLDEGWKLDTAREACYKALAEVGKDSMHFRPAEEQNKHKVTCGVATPVLDRVLSTVQGTLDAAGVSANVITSGHGNWRFMDLVPINAGKLEALNYVRQRYGFPVTSTVACGDSGNDILMLQGENPAIVVGNAQPDLKVWADARLAQEPKGTGPDGKSRLYLAPKHEALSILEGLAYWGFK